MERILGKGEHSGASNGRETYAVVFLARVAMEEFLEFIGCLPIKISSRFESFQRRRPKPALLIRAQASRTGRRFQELAPNIHDLLDVLVHHRVQESRKPRARAHGPVEEGIDRQADDVVLLCLGDPVGWCGEDMVDDAEHVVVGADLLLTAGVFFVLLLFGDLVEHLGEKQIEASVGFDSILE